MKLLTEKDKHKLNGEAFNLISQIYIKRRIYIKRNEQNNLTYVAHKVRGCYAYKKKNTPNNSNVSLNMFTEGLNHAFQFRNNKPFRN